MSAYKELSPRTDKLMDVIRSTHGADYETKEIRGIIEELLHAAYLAGKQDVLEEMQPAMDALKSVREIL